MQPAVHRLSMEYRTGRSDREMVKKSIYSLAPLPGRRRNTKRQTDLGIPSPHFRILILSIWNVLVQDSHRPLVHDGRRCLAHIIIFRFKKKNFFERIKRRNISCPITFFILRLMRCFVGVLSPGPHTHDDSVRCKCRPCL